MNNFEHLITSQCPSWKPQALAFILMPPDMDSTAQILLQVKNCSGMTWWMWQSPRHQHGLQIPQIPIRLCRRGISYNKSDPWWTHCGLGMSTGVWLLWLAKWGICKDIAKVHCTSKVIDIYKLYSAVYKIDICHTIWCRAENQLA